MDMDDRLGRLDWPAILGRLDAEGAAPLGGLLAPAECAALAALEEEPDAFRSRIDMARHGFGRGRYGYFAEPLPPLVAALRAGLYPRLLPLARAWEPEADFPESLAAFRARCHAAGQTRPTPLLLRYGPGDWNALHQDLYGGVVFPIQVVVLLDEPGRDFQGGEFLLTEQRPRRQSRALVVPLRQGEAAAFAVNRRPVAGARGRHRVAMRHGVSVVRGGLRRTLGIIFHDAA